MKVVNLTPHPIALWKDGSLTTFESQGEARVSEVHGAPWVSGLYPIPIRGPTLYGNIIGLPARTPEPIIDEVISGPHGPPDTVYIVSHLVAEKLREQTRAEREKEWGKDVDVDRWFKRDDIVTPGDLVRDESGRVVGCTTFVALW
jgi:hypothetical protein